LAAGAVWLGLVVLVGACGGGDDAADFEAPMCEAGEAAFALTMSDDFELRGPLIKYELTLPAGGGPGSLAIEFESESGVSTFGNLAFDAWPGSGESVQVRAHFESDAQTPSGSSIPPLGGCVEDDTPGILRRADDDLGVEFHFADFYDVSGEPSFCGENETELAGCVENAAL
jgi:hypothetical protein